MKKIILLLAISSLSLAYTAAHAQSKPVSADQKTPEQIFKEMDTNGDGFITEDEVRAYHKKFHESINKKGDGKITEDEALAAGISHERFMQVKKPGKNHIEFEDSLPVEMARFKDADANHDGKVSWDEYQAHVKKVGGQ